ncbi:MAG: ATP-dependent DNA helicase RecG [Spirochaetes bacterium]|nr:ATP-dependent DNA helicase RecG [Spirochaetota bacterium]
MFLHELRQPAATLRGAGPLATAKLARIGINTIADLLIHYPRDYEDRSTLIPFASFTDDRPVLTIAEVSSHEWFGFGRMKTLKIRVRDESSEACLICFNRPFLERSLPVGSTVLVHGRFQFRYGEIQSSSFDVEKIEAGKKPEAGLLPLYPLTEGLAQGSLRRLVRSALEMYGRRVEDEIDPELAASRGLIGKAQALSAAHFPLDQDQAEAARRSLAYEELFKFQLGIALRISARKAQNLERKPSTGILARRLIERLPFELTEDQKKAIQEIGSDLDAPHPMARLLQGDVGSGKTIVALISALHAVERGEQSAIMAPTEILARQHAAVAASLVEPLGVRLAFLSGNVEDASRPSLLSALAEGRIDIVIGTHALFSRGVAYRSLSFVVIDEQHRFGVSQRTALYEKGRLPDMLMMTATPIPRSLALTLFGDLAVSTIRSVPPGRKPVVTHLARQGNESRVYEFVRKLLAEGRQAFFVYPLIGESEKSDLKGAEDMAKRLAEEIYPEFDVSLLHSRLKEERKSEIMEEFIKGKAKVLVATTVVEVGVDVPNAAVMVVEHAERFGLSALHQLRGRVGRGEYQSYCFLVYSEGLSDDAIQRLKALYSSSDGFALAEEDLKIRGPGELLGTAQSGSLRLTIADPIRDFDLLKEARTDAFALVESDQIGRAHVIPSIEGDWRLRNREGREVPET